MGRRPRLARAPKANGPAMADKTLPILSRVFNWHAARTDDFYSPIVRGMARTLEAWADDSVPAEAGALARNEADEHRARFTQAHGPILT